MVAQIMAVVIFLGMFLLLITEKVERYLVTLGCALLTIVVLFGLCMHDAGAIADALSLHSIVRPSFWYSPGGAEPSTGINWETIFFITGMMVMVENMADSGFFRWLCMELARRVHYRVSAVFVLFMILSAVLSMFIDSITVIMFLATVTVELSQMLKIDPTPMILSEVFCANLGGSATMCGDPPNIIIGTSLGYTFGDFISNTGLIALIAMIAVIPYFYLLFRKQLVCSDSALVAELQAQRTPIADRKSFACSCAIFICAVVLLITHAQTGLTVSAIGVIIAVLTLLAAQSRAKALIMRLDYQTLLFFIGLFVVVSGLEHTGILQILADLIAKAANGNAKIMIAIIIWGSAVASAFIDNIPFAATMIPVIRSLSAMQGVDLSVLAWSLSIGTDIGGSATPIGASANVVGTSIAAKCGHPISWGRYCKVQIPATILVLVISTGIIFIRYF